MSRSCQAVKETTLPWVEKYRPHKLDDVVHQEDVIFTLKRSLDSPTNLPHLLFHGPPGTGKTSTILAVAKQLYGPTLWRHRVLELNASHERGIDVIRTRVKHFAQQRVVGADDDDAPGYPCPPYKIIILDEADSMTRDAQTALRRTLEKYTKGTRFCIICNHLSRIIEPLASRCSKFRFKPLSEQAMTKRLSQICDMEMENFQEVRQVLLPPLIRMSEGDMRKGLTLMQSACCLIKEDKKVDTSVILEVAGMIPDHVIDGLMAAVRQSNDFQALHQKAQDVIASGFCLDDVLKQLQQALIEDIGINNVQKAHICLKLAKTEKTLLDQADEFIQLLDVLSFISTTLHKKSL